jgi:Tol biopolymer transport system component
MAIGWRFVRGNMSGSPLREVIPDDRPLTRLAEGEEGHLTPLLMRNGWLLFTSVRGGFLSGLNSISSWRPEATQASEVVPNASSPQLLGTDAIVFARGRALFAAGFDSRAIRLTGEPRAMNVQVQTTLYSGAPMFAVANNGTLVYPESPGGRRLVWIDRDGREQFVKTEERMYSHLRLSPDGTRVATYVLDADRDLWVISLDGSFVYRLSAGAARDTMPAWSPDGSQIFFTSAERNINRIPADRSTGPEVIFRQPMPDRLHPLSVTPDRKHLLMQWDIMPKRIDLRLLELGATPQLKPLLGESGTERDAQLSRDGKWIVYASAEAATGASDGQIMVRPFPKVDAFRTIISPGVGRQPTWSRDGREIFYRTEDGSVMSVPITIGPAPPYLTAGNPVRVVTPVNTIRDWATGPNYDVSPDGRRFLFIRAPELDIRSLTVVLNWDVEVKAAISGKGR